MSVCRCGKPAVVQGFCAGCAEKMRQEIMGSLDDSWRLQLERKERSTPFRASDQVISQVEVDGSARVVYVAATCPVCSQPCARPKVLYSRLGAVRRHTDLYAEYELLDANRYEFMACTHCGYAAPESSFSLLGLDEAQRFRAMTENWELASACDGERSEAVALMGYRLSLFFASRRLRGAAGLQGRVQLRLAWLHRMAGRKNEELTALGHAATLLEQSYSSDRPGPEKGSDLQLQYLIGELNLRLGRVDEAVRWLHRAISAPARGAEGKEKALAKMAKSRLEDAMRVHREEADLASIPWVIG